MKVVRERTHLYKPIYLNIISFSTVIQDPVLFENKLCVGTLHASDVAVLLSAHRKREQLSPLSAMLRVRSFLSRHHKGFLFSSFQHKVNEIRQSR